MIQEELRKFIEQNCSGKEPSDLIMEAIGKKIEQLGADADEVLAFVEECTKGPTLEEKIAEAKRQVFGKVAIDMIAGPSEILVVSDGKSDPDIVAADMLSQAEHDKNASAVLVTETSA